MSPEEKLYLLRLQKENIELKGLILGTQLRLIEAEIEKLVKEQNELSTTS